MDSSALSSSNEISYALTSLLGVVRWPEAIAAIALVIQVFILWQHRRILSESGETLERQAETTKMIAHSLEQHGRILADHTRIMDEQFKFQKKIEAKFERSMAPAPHSDRDSALVPLVK